MFKSQREPSRVAKALTICAIGMGVGFGTCGLMVATSAVGGRVGGIVASAGALLFFVSLGGAVLTILIYLIGVLFEK